MNNIMLLDEIIKINIPKEKQGMCSSFIIYKNDEVCFYKIIISLENLEWVWKNYDFHEKHDRVSKTTA